MAKMPLVQYELKLQAYLEQLKVVEYTRFNAVVRQLDRLIASAFNELDGELSDLRRAGLNSFIKKVTTQQAAMMGKATDAHVGRLKTFGSYSYQIEASLLRNMTGASIRHATKARAIWGAVSERPLGSTGDLLQPWLKHMTTSQVSTLEKTLRKAHVNKWTNQETLQVLRGTKAKGYADGLVSRFGKQNATVIKTAMQHVNNEARQVLWAENDDIVTGYQWVSVLDDRTSEICEELDGEVFEFGDGPVPPAHPNCRSTTVAVLDKRFDILDKGATRSSASGYVSTDTTYAEWAKQQGD